MTTTWQITEPKLDNTKEIKNASECIVEFYKHTGIFKNRREVQFSSVLKNSQVLNI